MADFDVSKLSRADQIIGVSAIVLFVFSFFDWFAVDLGPGLGSSGGNAWDFTLCWLAVIIGLVMLVQIVLAKFSSVDMPNLGGVTWGQIHMVLGIVAFAFVLIKLISGVDTGPLDIDIKRKIGIFVGLIAAAGLAVGGYLKMQEEKGAAPASGAGPGPIA